MPNKNNNRKDNNVQKRFGRNDFIMEAKKREKSRNNVPIKLMIKIDFLGTFIPFEP